jgi:hypothetical protein
MIFGVGAVYSQGPPSMEERTMRTMSVAMVIALSTVTPLSAQRNLPIGGSRPALQLQVIKPFVSRDGPFAGARFASSGWDVSVVYPISGGPTVYGRMGSMYASIEGFDGSLSLSNPRIGAMVGSNEGGRRAEFHVDLPFAQEFGEGYATAIAIFSDYEELERFELDSWAVGASASAEIEPGPGAFVGVRAGATVLVPTDGGSDTFARFAFFGHAPTDRTRFRFEVASQVLLTRSELTFSEKSTFFGGLEVTWPFTRFSPTLFIRAPLDETLDARVPLTAGLRLLFGR